MERKSSPLNFGGARDLDDSSLKGKENDRYELIQGPDSNLASPNSSSPPQISVSQLVVIFNIQMPHTRAIWEGKRERKRNCFWRKNQPPGSLTQPSFLFLSLLLKKRKETERVPSSSGRPVHDVSNCLYPMSFDSSLYHWHQQASYTGTKDKHVRGFVQNRFAI